MPMQLIKVKDGSTSDTHNISLGYFMAVCFSGLYDVYSIDGHKVNH